MAYALDYIVNRLGAFMQSWKSHAPDAQFGGMSLEEFINATNDSLRYRNEIAALETRIKGLKACRDDADKASKSALAQSLKAMSGGLMIKTNINSADLRETVKGSIAQNVSLIKSIPAEYLQKVSGAVFRSVTSGQGMADLKPQIQKYGDMTERRAKNVALDQTRKAYNSINADRMRKVGIKKFKWVHSGGGLHPREDHIAMSGNIYSFDDLPIIDQKTGERGLPGQAPNCKCFQIPVIEFDQE
jgi:SPP1 gp7 family putative phage head morphogenesis protein